MTEIAKEAFATRSYMLAVDLYEPTVATSLDVLYNKYGESLARSGKVREAIDVYARCLSPMPNDHQRMRLIADALVQDILSCCRKNNVVELSSNNNWQKFDASFACGICEGALYQPVTLNCGHTFCRNCVLSDNNNNKSSCCYCKSCGARTTGVSETNVLVQRLVEKWWPRECEANRASQEAQLLMSQGQLARAIDRYNLAVHLGQSLLFFFLVFFF